MAVGLIPFSSKIGVLSIFPSSAECRTPGLLRQNIGGPRPVVRKGEGSVVTEVTLLLESLWSGHGVTVPTVGSSFRPRLRSPVRGDRVGLFKCE